MLQELKIKNLAVIEEVTCSFENGFNVLTGETGAGKSIVIDALELVLGSRSSANLIRTGKEKAMVQALFNIQGIESVKAKLVELGVDGNEDELLMTREINQNGKNTCRINGQMVTTAMLKEMGQYLIDIHGQHGHQSLFSKAYHQVLLDRFGQVDLSMIQHAVKQYHQVKKELEQLGGNKQELARTIDLLQYQIREIEDVNPVVNEDQDLIAERQILRHAEKLDYATGKAYAFLQEGEEHEASILNLLGEVLACLEEVMPHDQRLQSFIEHIQEATFQLEEVSRDLRHYRENIEGDPYRLEYVEQRLETINGLKRKYGSTIQEILEYHKKVANEIEYLQQSEERRVCLEEKIKEIEQTYKVQAQVISEKRRAVAAQLERIVMNELVQLGMPKAIFKVHIESGKEDLSFKGNDEVEFLFTANPGELPKPLGKVASGGEMSRVMLALKVIFAKIDTIATLVFDEIDVGISGRIAQVVAEKMATVSRFCQVICVTHLPQTASMGDNHYRVIKDVGHEQTFVNIEHLIEQERIEELAKMLGGAEVTDTTLSHAREMLLMTEDIKKNIKA